MTAFTFALSPTTRYATALVVAHGITDLDNPTCLLDYMIWVLMPLPSKCVTGLFCALSIVHFAADSSPTGSVIVHSLVLVVGIRYGRKAAFQAMLTYLVALHVPAHYDRCWRAGRRRALAVAAATSAAALVLASRSSASSATLTDLAQRLAMAHIAVEGGREF